MTAPFTPADNRLLDLLADQATGDLDTHHATELMSLLEQSPDCDRHAIDRVAALLELSSLGSIETPPPALMARLRSTAFQQTWEQSGVVEPLAHDQDPSTRPAQQWRGGGEKLAFDGALAGRGRNPEVPQQAARFNIDIPAHPSTLRDGLRRSLRWSGWAVAACVALAWSAVWLLSEGDQITAPTRSREALLAMADTIKLPWQSGPDSTGQSVTGRVVWNPSSQQGFMEFSGLQTNEPTQEQYQLWVFDADRDERYPVHGGVFNIAPGQTQAVVPIETRLGVERATAFVVTVERPGGVWVSDRSRIAALAAIGL